MHESAISILNLMFRPEESICVSPNKYGFHSIPLRNVLGGTVSLVSPNPDIPVQQISSSELLMVALNPIKGFRRDSNCVAFRNFLVEMDIGSTSEQMGTIKYLKMPYSAVIFSGNKSLHFLISLEEDLPSENVYREYASWILSIVTLADQNIKNASRSIRLPGVRRDTGKLQELVELKGSVKLTELLAWLKHYPRSEPKSYEEQDVSESPNPFKVPRWIMNQLRDGIDFRKGRNHTWFSIACGFAQAGFSQADTQQFLSQYFGEDRDFTEREWASAIKSAHKYMNGE